MDIKKEDLYNSEFLKQFKDSGEFSEEVVPSAGFGLLLRRRNKDLTRAVRSFGENGLVM